MSEQAIVLNQLTKHYGTHRGINDLSFSVNEGEFFGFIGPNGAGKSTTIRTLMGLIHPSGGNASIFGLDCQTKASVIARDVGYLPSENSYYENMKVRELLQYTADLYGMDCETKMYELSERLNLDLTRKIADLSLGNKKKVGIVSAIMTSPKLLIMDEPTSGLDPLMQREFFSILQERNREGATVFLSSHILSEIQRNCTRAAIIREGTLLACGSVEELARTNARRVTLRGSAEVQVLSGIRDCRQTEEGLSFLYSGDMQLLLNALAGGKVEDLTIAEPDLEEVFLHYYEKEESK